MAGSIGRMARQAADMLDEAGRTDDGPKRERLAELAVSRVILVHATSGAVLRA